MNINCQIPINNLSFGYVGFQILQELYNKKVDFSLFPIGPLKPENFDSFDKANPDFVKYVFSSASSSLKTYNKKDPTLRLWHIGGSQESVGENQVLLTFFELDQITETEANILNNQKAVIVTSEEAKQVFLRGGVKVPIFYVPLGFDKTYFHKTNKRYYSDEITTFLISGKLEFRKATAEVIQAWVKKFGNNPLFRLHINVYNPFLSPEDNKNILNQIYQGKRYTNVVDNLPYVKTLSEVNDTYNSCDIVIDMGNEGWSLPSFHTTGLGKHAILLNCAGIKGWATSQNAVLVQPSGKKQVYDNIFFHKGVPFNQGNIYCFKEEDLLLAFDEAIKRKISNKINTEGLKIPSDFTWEKTVSKILNILANEQKN